MAGAFLQLALFFKDIHVVEGFLRAWPKKQPMKSRVLREAVMPGFMPGIHAFPTEGRLRRGWPGQARP